MCVYCEIFELNFCNFNYNLRRNIIKRGEEDANNNRKTENFYNIIDDEKDNESKNENQQLNCELPDNNNKWDINYNIIDHLIIYLVENTN